MGAQPHREVAVELDHGQLAQAFDQRLGQRGEAGADLDHELARLGRDLVDDGFDDGLVGQEMLAEALARLVGCVHWGGSRYSM